MRKDGLEIFILTGAIEGKSGNRSSVSDEFMWMDGRTGRGSDWKKITKISK